jgi:hypothetical protein
VNHAARAQQWDQKWMSLPNERALYAKLDTPASRAVFDSWHYWSSQSTEATTTLAEGRFKNTVVGQSLIFFASGHSCIACAAPATAHARITLGLAGADATLIQLPLCGDHLEAACAEPNVLAFLAKIFSMSFDLPRLIRNGWILEIELATGWHWIIRVKSLVDYAYMLFNPSEKKAVYRADSARHHPELPFFPDHEHSKPDRTLLSSASSRLERYPELVRSCSPKIVRLE